MRQIYFTFAAFVIFAGTGLAAAPTPPTMKAVVIHSYGGPEVLQYEDVPRPEPKEDEILIRVIAAGVNPVDAKVRHGPLARMATRDPFPMRIGYDVAGIVEKSGPKVARFKAGDAVYAYLSIRRGGGAYAEYAVAKESETALKPMVCTFEEAASLPIAATTAWQALVEDAKLQSGQTVLIHGGSGGVGSMAIQIAKSRGAKVIATASTANQDLLKRLGADQTIDYTTAKFEDVAKDVDVVLDTVGGETLTRSYKVMKKGGAIVSIVDEPNQSELASHEVKGSNLMAHPDSNVLAEIAKLVDQKKITPLVSQVLPLSDAVKAHQQIETQHTRGKIVLRVGEPPKP